MGHRFSKDIYQDLVTKLDSLHVRVPKSQALYDLMKLLFSEHEADIYIKMPYTFSDLTQIEKVIKSPRRKLPASLKNCP